ncbi:MAG: hypothetical protein R3C16_05330 [Hyphomonadaceae bacterium]
MSTLMPYKDAADAIALANRGKGSLVMSAFTYDAAFARDVVLGAGAFHGRIAFIDRDSAKSTGHGSPDAAHGPWRPRPRRRRPGDGRRAA